MPADLPTVRAGARVPDPEAATLRPEAPAAPPVRTRFASAAAGVAVTAATLWLALTHLPQPFPSDQTNYMDAAAALPDPPPPLVPAHQALRLGLVLPLRGALEVFGYSQATYFVVPVLSAVALALGVLVLGSLLLSRVVGSVAAVLVVASNVLFFDLLQPLPDVLATALLTWAFVLAVALRQDRPAVSATARRRLLAFVALGALLGWSYLTREFIVFAWPAVALLLARRSRPRELVALAVPLALCAALELAAGALVYGDPLMRLGATSSHGEVEVSPQLADTYQDQPLGWYVTRFWHGLSVAPEGWWLQAAVVGLLVGGLVARRRLGVLLLWAAAVAVPLLLLGGVLDPSQPMLRLAKMRYWFPVMVPVLLGGLGALWLGVRAAVRRVPPLAGGAGAVAAVVVVAVGGAVVADARPGWDVTVGYRVVDGGQLDSLRDWLAAEGTDVPVVRADTRTLSLVRLYSNGPFGAPVWSGELVALDHGAAAPTPGEHVVLFSTASAELCWSCKRGAETVLGRPVRVPDSWTLAHATPDGQLLVYRVG